MTQPNPEVDELVEILKKLEEIEEIANTCEGQDKITNKALSIIAGKAGEVIRIVRSLDETNMFSPEELARYMDRSPANERDL